MQKLSYLFLVLFFILMTINSRATGPDAEKTFLTGKITDKLTGETIPGATVYIPELKTGTLADINGIYKIVNLPQAIVIVQVSFLGYKSISEKVDLSVTSLLNFTLELTITEIGSAFVTGTLRSTEIKRNPVPMITLDSKYLQQNLNTNII